MCTFIVLPVLNEIINKELPEWDWRRYEISLYRERNQENGKIMMRGTLELFRLSDALSGKRSLVFQWCCAYKPV
jgi:hypothetical protein